MIGAETFSRILDWEDRTTCVLFGDGAGAIVLAAEESADDAASADARGILATRLHADGRHNDLLYVDGGPSTTGTVGKVRMKGREVFRHAVVNLASVMEEALRGIALTPADVDWVVPHQANARINDLMKKNLGFPDDLPMANDIENTGNTSAASIPLAMEEMLATGKAKGGQIALLLGFGSGLAYSGQVVTLPPAPAEDD